MKNHLIHHYKTRMVLKDKSSENHLNFGHYLRDRAVTKTLSIICTEGMPMPRFSTDRYEIVIMFEI